MLRIELDSDQQTRVIRLIGRLEAANLSEVRTQRGCGGGRVAMDLKEVTFVDHDAVQFLSGCEDDGVELRHCPPYLRNWIGQEREGRERTIPEQLYLEDLFAGQRFGSGTYRMEESRMKSFAEEFDPQRFHLDEGVARDSIFRGLAASGWHTAAVSMRLLVTGGLPVANGIIGLGGEIAWPAPTRSGDELHVESEILEVLPSRSKPNQGVVTVRNVTLNQAGTPVYQFTAKILVFRRNAHPSGAR